MNRILQRCRLRLLFSNNTFKNRKKTHNFNMFVALMSKRIQMCCTDYYWRYFLLLASFRWYINDRVSKKKSMYTHIRSVRNQPLFLLQSGSMDVCFNSTKTILNFWTLARHWSQGDVCHTLSINYIYIITWSEGMDD